MPDPDSVQKVQSIFIVVPAHNESKVIRGVASRLRRRFADVVIVDDGSVDGTFDALTGSGVHVLRHIINRGQGAALQTGIEFALRKGADVIVTFDADGQHDERDVEALVSPILAGKCDVALGSRFLGSAIKMPFARLVLLKTAILFTRMVSNIRVSDVHNGLRAFSRRAAASLHITVDGMGHASEILDQVKSARWAYCEVPVTITYSEYSLSRGQSSWNAIWIGSQVLLRKLTR